MKKTTSQTIKASISTLLSINLFIPTAAWSLNANTQLITKSKQISNNNCSLNQSEVDLLNTGLLQLGFGSYYKNQWQDHASIANDYLQLNKYYKVEGEDDSQNMNKLQLMRNIISYDAVKGAKEVVLQIMKRTGGCFYSKSNQKNYYDLISTLFSFKPWSLSNQPATKGLFTNGGVFTEDGMEVLEAQGKQLETEADKALTKQTDSLRSVMELHSKKLTQELVYLTQSLMRLNQNNSINTFSSEDSAENLAKLFYPNIAKIVRLTYLDHQIGRTFWLGRALLGASLIQLANKSFEDRESFYHDINLKISNDTRFKNFKLENIVGDKWLLANESLDTKEMYAESKRIYEEKRKDFKNFINSIVDGTILDQINPSKIAEQFKVPEDLFTNFDIDKILPPIVDYREIPVTDMSYVLTRNISVEAAMIPSGAIPPEHLAKNPKNNSLIGKYIGAINYVSAEDAKDSNKFTELREKAYYRTMNDGFSHIGYAHLRTFQINNQDITFSWVIDNYPSPAADAETDIQGPYNSAGVRFIGLEQYYKASNHTHLMVANIDPQMFSDFALKQTNKVLTEEDFENLLSPIKNDRSTEVRKALQVIKPTLDKNGKPVPTVIDGNTNVSSKWEMEINYDEFKKLHQLNSTSNYETWYKAVTKRAAQQLTEFLYKGMTFVWITPNGQYYKGGAYCSLTGSLAYKLGTGLDIQDSPDVWDDVVGHVAKLYDTAEFISQACDKVESLDYATKFISFLNLSETSKKLACSTFEDSAEQVKNYVNSNLNPHSTIPAELAAKLFSGYCHIGDEREIVCAAMKSLATNTDIKNIKTLSTMPIVAPSGLAAQNFVPAHNMFTVEAPFMAIQDRLESSFTNSSYRNFSLEFEGEVNLGIENIIRAVESNQSFNKIFNYKIPTSTNSEIQNKMVKNLDSIDFTKMYLDPSEVRGLTMDLLENSLSKMGCAKNSISKVCRDSVLSK